MKDLLIQKLENHSLFNDFTADKHTFKNNNKRNNMRKSEMKDLLIQKLREKHSLRIAVNKLRREWSQIEKEIEDLVERLS